MAKSRPHFRHQGGPEPSQAPASTEDDVPYDSLDDDSDAGDAVRTVTTSGEKETGYAKEERSVKADWKGAADGALTKRQKKRAQKTRERQQARKRQQGQNTPTHARKAKPGKRKAAGGDA